MKLLIVDDEWFVRDGLLHNLNMQKLGITEVYTADDGKAGYALARDESPDIVLADVRMPRMDGVALCKRLKKLLPHSSLIMMSAYSDIAYLKSAIEVSALRYLDKPLEYPQVEAVLREAVLLQLQSRLTRQKNEDIRKQLASCLPIVRTDTFTKLLLAKPGEAAQLVPFFQQFEPGLDPDGDYCVALLRALHRPDAKPFSHDVLKAFLSGCPSLAKVRTAYLPEGYHVLLYPCLDRAHPADALHAALLSWRHQEYPLQLLLAEPVKGLVRIAEAYRKATELLNPAFFGPFASAVYRPERRGALLQAGDILTSFADVVESGNKALILEKLDAVFVHISRHPGTSTVFAQHIAEQMLNLLVSHARRLGCDVKDVDRICGILRTAPLFADAISALKAMACEVFEAKDSRSVAAFLIDDVCLFIQREYADPGLSLDRLSDAFHVSPAHLCVLFKRERNGTLNQYILKTRMRHAKELLKNPAFRIKDVATKTGFNDCNYFIRCFKRMAGTTPMQYKKERLNAQAVRLD